MPGRPGYIVSSLGRSAKLMSNKGGGRLPYVTRSTPKPGGGRYRDYLHHWVAWAFLGPRTAATPVVRHLNDDPLDNRAENLSWGTHGENSADVFSNGKRIKRSHCRHGHELAEPNLTSEKKCKACSRARAAARANQVPVTQALRDLKYKEVIQ